MLFKVLIYARYKWQGMKMFHLKKGRLMKFTSYDLLEYNFWGIAFCTLCA